MCLVDTVNTVNLAHRAPAASAPAAADPGGQLIRAVVAAANRLSLPAHLADGPRAVADLARATGTHAPSLHRLLRMLACTGRAAEVTPGVFGAAPGEFRADADQPASAGRAGGAMTPIGALLSEGSLLYTVRTGRPAASALLGEPVFDYIAGDPQASAALATFTAAATEHEAPAIVAAARFTRFGHVIDVGGGTGALIKHVLLGSPATHGTVFDTAGSAPAATRLLSAVPALADRWTVQAGSFFDGVPAGGDAYLLKNVLHDWDDPTSVRLLRVVAAVMEQTARLIIIEPVLPDFAAWSPAHLPAVLSDVVCMVMSDGGRERTETEYRALLAEAGFAFVDARPVIGSAHFHLVEAALAGQARG